MRVIATQLDQIKTW